jgi:hypothetical protein
VAKETIPGIRFRVIEIPEETLVRLNNIDLELAAGQEMIKAARIERDKLLNQLAVCGKNESWQVDESGKFLLVKKEFARDDE